MQCKLALLLLALLCCGGLAAAQFITPGDDGSEYEVVEAEAELAGADVGAGDAAEDVAFYGEDERRRSLLAAYPVPNLAAQVDVAAVNKLKCGDYWLASAPRGSSGPNSAYRVGMRDTVTAIGAELGLARPSQLLQAQSVLCQNPAASAAGGATSKRIRLTTKVKVPTEHTAAYLAKLAEKYADGSFTAAVRARMPAKDTAWNPRTLAYKNGDSATCDPADFATGCASKKWVPSRVTINGP